MPVIKVACPTCGGRKWLQHRYVMTQHLGRELRSDEHVHHRDGNKTNNSIDNLELLGESAHHSSHMTPERAKAMSLKGHEARWGGHHSTF
jgi:hypothetical protein